MDLTDYVRCDATALREHIAAGDVTPAEVRTVARQAIEAANEVVNGLAAPLYRAALDHAADGPFGGVPFLIKDSGPMAEGREFFLGSRCLRDGVRAWRDTDLMCRFRAAGLATLGLTTAPELSLSFATEPLRTGPTRNPWDPDRGVGGSSGGAAALVASGAVAAPVLSAPRRPDPAQLEAVNREIMAEVTRMSALDLMAMLAAQNRVTRAVGAFFTDHDLLVTPTLARLPPPHGTLSSDRPGHTLDTWLRTLFDHGPFTAVFNVSGQPALSLPLAHSDSGLPIGVQFVAPYGREDILFRVAGLLEQAMPWRDRTPTVLIGPTTG